jgi:hypothetical protein
VPFFTLAGYMLAFDLIDAAIGPAAGRTHGYTFLVLVVYPFLMPVYWLVMWLFDLRIKPVKGTEG